MVRFDELSKRYTRATRILQYQSWHANARSSNIDKGSIFHFSPVRFSRARGKIARNKVVVTRFSGSIANDLVLSVPSNAKHRNRTIQEGWYINRDRYRRYRWWVASSDRRNWFRKGMIASDPARARPRDRSIDRSHTACMCVHLGFNRDCQFGKVVKCLMSSSIYNMDTNVNNGFVRSRCIRCYEQYKIVCLNWECISCSLQFNVFSSVNAHRIYRNRYYSFYKIKGSLK